MSHGSGMRARIVRAIPKTAARRPTDAETGSAAQSRRSAMVWVSGGPKCLLRATQSDKCVIRTNGSHQLLCGI